MDDRIEPLQLDTSIGSRETPIDCSLIGIAFGFPRGRLANQKLSSRDMCTQTLATENAAWFKLD
jgi:hypothetical protein